MLDLIVQQKKVLSVHAYFYISIFNLYEYPFGSTYNNKWHHSRGVRGNCFYYIRDKSFRQTLSM